MNLMAGFLGFSAFTITCLAIGLLGYWQADRLENYARIYARKARQKSAMRRHR